MVVVIRDVKVTNWNFKAPLRCSKQKVFYLDHKITFYLLNSSNLVRKHLIRVIGFIFLSKKLIKQHFFPRKVIFLYKFDRLLIQG